VKILTDENLHKYINVYVDGDELVIETTETIQSDDGIKVFITFDQLESLELKGASTISSESTLKSKELFVEINGAGVVKMDIDVKDLEVEISGAGLIDLSGKADHQTIDLGGAGNLNAYDLKCKSAEIELSGIGAAQVNVSERLYARVTGVGSIKYKGNPEVVDTEITGLGKIEAADEDDESEIDIDINL